jgi:uncharacterized Zn-binding protein involved in type VI secretion
MSGFLLTVGSTVLCAHGGQAKATVPNSRVQVMGQPITTLGPPYAVAGCANPPPPANIGPCILGNWIMGATRVKAMGMPVLLQSSQAICVPTGTPLSVVFANIRVKGM